jgi:hypothetical protein
LAAYSSGYAHHWTAERPARCDRLEKPHRH